VLNNPKIESPVIATLGQGGVEQVRCAFLQQHVSVQGRLSPPLHCQGDYDSSKSVPGKGNIRYCKGLDKSQICAWKKNTVLYKSQICAWKKNTVLCKSQICALTRTS
jgi:hypothetical protein